MFIVLWLCGHIHQLIIEHKLSFDQYHHYHDVGLESNQFHVSIFI